MDKYSRRLLKFIKEFRDRGDGVIYIDKLYDAYNEYSKIPEKETVACLRYLEKQGYVTWGRENGKAVSVIIEHKGLHPYAIGLEEFKKFLFESVFIPVAVSLITTIITLWLTKSSP